MSANGNPSLSLDFRLLFESAPGLHLVMDPSFTVVAVNDAHLRATLKKREEVLGRNVFDIFPDNPGDPGATGSRSLRASLELVLATKRPDVMSMLKYDILRPESQGGGFEERHWIPINAPALDANGEVMYIVQRVEDVTEFVRLTRTGQEMEPTTEALRTQAEQTEAQIYLRSLELGEANRQLVTANQELARLYEQISALVTQAGNELTFPGEAPIVADASHPMSSEEMLGRMARLIVGHKRLEEELRQSQKMEAVGRLAGGIAHDFNNILTVINGYCSLLLNSLKSEDPVYRRLEEISKAGQRAADLTQQLLIFSRRQVLEPVVVNLASTLQEMDRMLRRLLGADIEIATSIDRELAKVKVDPGQIQQVIMNLVVNSRDAMPKGGKLTLQLTNVEVDPRQMPHYGIPHGSYVMLAVTDSGTGMTPEVQQQIFEPFFTTKESGKGTGLGLATVYGIVRQSGGHIWLYSEVGVGTTFKVFFPQVHEKTAPAPALAPASIAHGDETLLVVEDDSKVRGLVREILQGAGYNVLLAGDASEAQQACKDYPGEIHLLLTDVVLPKTSGKEIANRLLTIRPDLKVLFMSGYTGEAMAHHEILTEPSIEFLQKPFGPAALCGKIRAILDTATPKIRILVVDDEAAIRELIQTILESEGFRVATAGNGREAREKAKKQSFDLVLTDLSMPEEEGIEMIGRLRADHPELKIIAMSGAFGSDVMAAARVLGANATLMKPLNSVALVSIIHRLVDPPSEAKVNANS